MKYEIDACDLYESINLGKNIVVVDARSPEAYAERHNPNAITQPHRIMNAESTAHLDRDPLYVTYYDGIGCNESTLGALYLVRLCFNVKELMGGCAMATPPRDLKLPKVRYWPAVAEGRFY